MCRWVGGATCQLSVLSTKCSRNIEKCIPLHNAGYICEDVRGWWLTWILTNSLTLLLCYTIHAQWHSDRSIIQHVAVPDYQHLPEHLKCLGFPFKQSRMHHDCIPSAHANQGSDDRWKGSVIVMTYINIFHSYSFPMIRFWSSSRASGGLELTVPSLWLGCHFNLQNKCGWESGKGALALYSLQPLRWPSAGPLTITAPSGLQASHQTMAVLAAYSLMLTKVGYI